MQRRFIKGALWIMVYYAFFGLTYWILLYSTYGNYMELDTGKHSLIAFSVRCLFSIAVFWFIFIQLQSLKLIYRLAFHLITLPLYLWLALISFHSVCDFFGVLYVKGRFVRWDIYIPMILYIGLFALIHSYEYFVLLKNQKIRAASLQIKVLQANLDLLKSRIQPHFLYNTLNSINAMLDDDQKEAKQAIVSLSDVFRFMLNASYREWMSFEDELLFLQEYLSIEQMRFKDRLLVHFHVSDQVETYAVPSMLLQPLIENAIVHSVAVSRKPVNLFIKISRKEEKIWCEVCDDGVGSAVEPKDLLLRKGTGLKNVHQRLLLLFKDGLMIRGNIPGGLCISFAIPAIKYESRNESIHNDNN